MIWILICVREGRYESEQPEYHDNHGPEKIV